MIEMVTRGLADIKSSPQPKIYAEMMTIRLAEDSSPSGPWQSRQLIYWVN